MLKYINYTISNLNKNFLNQFIIVAKKLIMKITNQLLIFLGLKLKLKYEKMVKF